MSVAKVKVLVVGPTPPPFHGVATFTRDLLRATHPHIDLIPLDTSDRRDASNIGRWDSSNLELGFASLAELAQQIPRAGIDIVYIPISQNVPAFIRDALYILQSRLMGARVVVHLHGGYFRTLYDRDAGGIFRLIARLSLSSVSAAIVLGEEFRPIFNGLIPDERIHVVENGVPDPGAWLLHPDASSPAANGGTLLYISTLTRAKGILELIQTAAILRRTRPQIQLRVAGLWQEESLRREVLALIERESLQSSVHFVGNVTGQSKAEFLASGHIFCLLTRYPYEGQPLVILEAMAAGLPILTTAHATIASTVPDGLAGRTLPIETTPERWAQVLNEMLADTEKLAEFRQAARARYLARYTSEVCHARLFDVLLQANGEGASSTVRE